MKRLGPSDLTPTLRHFDMVNDEVDCFYEGTEVVESDKLQNGKSSLHSFSKIQDRSDKFAVWGYGLLDSRLMGNKEKDIPPMEPGTPLRLIYRGKKNVKIKIGKKGKEIEKGVHQCEIYDITEEIESKEISETGDNLIYA